MAKLTNGLHKERVCPVFGFIFKKPKFAACQNGVVKAEEMPLGIGSLFFL